MENGKSKSQPKDFLPPSSSNLVNPSSSISTIGSRIHSPLPLPDSISRLIKDRWPERNTPTEILSTFLPFYRKTRNEEFVSEEFRETSKSIMIFFLSSMIWKKRRNAFNEKIAIRRETFEFASWPFDR